MSFIFIFIAFCNFVHWATHRDTFEYRAERRANGWWAIFWTFAALVVS